MFKWLLFRGFLNSTQEATQLTSGDALYNSSQNLVNVTGTVFSMYGVLIIVLISFRVLKLFREESGSNYRTFAFEFPRWRSYRRVKTLTTSDIPVKTEGVQPLSHFFRKQKMIEKIRHTWKLCKETAEEFLVDRCGQTLPGGNVMPVAVSIIAMLLIGYIGIMILQSTSESTTLTSGDKLYSAHQNLLNITGTTFSMYGVLLIVFIATIIIGLLITSFIGKGDEE